MPHFSIYTSRATSCITAAASDWRLRPPIFRHVVDLCLGGFKVPEPAIPHGPERAINCQTSSRLVHYTVDICPVACVLMRNAYLVFWYCLLASLPFSNDSGVLDDNASNACTSGSDNVKYYYSVIEVQQVCVFGSPAFASSWPQAQSHLYTRVKAAYPVHV